MFPVVGHFDRPLQSAPTMFQPFLRPCVAFLWPASLRNWAHYFQVQNTNTTPGMPTDWWLLVPELTQVSGAFPMSASESSTTYPVKCGAPRPWPVSGEHWLLRYAMHDAFRLKEGCHLFYTKRFWEEQINLTTPMKTVSRCSGPVAHNRLPKVRSHDG